MKDNEKKPETKNIDGTTIQVGMALVDKHSNFIGIIKEIQEKGFLVDRSEMQFEDLLVPFWVCMEDGPEQVKLEIGKNEVNTTVWRTPGHTE